MESKQKIYFNNLIIIQVQLNMQPALAIENIPLVSISNEGIFKYILIQVFIATKFTGRIVRGNTKYEYHAQNFKAFVEQLKSLGFQHVKINGKQISGKKGNVTYKFICQGGGRIEHNYNGKKCSIYGYSKTYGKVNHKIGQQLISRCLGYPKDQIVLGEKQY